MPKKKKKQRNVLPKGAQASTADEGSGDEAEASVSADAVTGETPAGEVPDCPHLSAASPERIKDVLKAGSALWCTDCLLSRGGEKGGKKKKNATQRKGKKEVASSLDPDDIWLCMTCGNPGCGRQTAGHAKEHQERSSKHALVMQQTTQRCWCYVCDKELIIPNRTPNCPYEKVRAVGDILRSAGAEGGAKKKNRLQQESIDEPEVSSSEPLFFHKDEPGLRGLRNLGNTCFFNSVMQNLAHSGVLRRGAVALEPVANYGRLSVAFLRFLSQMSAPGAGATVSPGNLFQEVIRKAPRFRGMQQQDSHELFHYLIDGVNDEEMKRLKVAPKPLPVPDEEGTEGEEMPAEGEGGSNEAKAVAAATEPAVFVASTDNKPDTSSLANDASKPAAPQEAAPVAPVAGPAQPAASSEPQTASSPTTTSDVNVLAVPSRSSQQAADAAPTTENITAASPTASSSSSKPAGLTSSPTEPAMLASTVSEPIIAQSPAPVLPLSTVTLDALNFNLPHHLKGFPRTFIECVFGGITVSRVTCHTCRRPSDTVESSLDFSLPIQNEAIFFAAAAEDRSGYGGGGRKKKRQQNAEKVARAQEFMALIDSAISKENGGEDAATATQKDEVAKVEELVVVATTDAKQGSDMKPEDATAAGAGAESIAAPLVTVQPDSVKPNSEIKSSAAVETKSPEASNKPPSFDARNVELAAQILSGLSVDTCLWRYTSPEVLSADNAFGCEYCTRSSGARVTGRTADLVKRRATKQVLIRHVPRVLVLHLKRFHQTARGLSKLSTDVKFRTTIDVTPFCEPGRAPASPVYRLSGIVEHAGSLSSGHYTAYIRNQDKWYYFSDSHFNAVSEAQVLNAEAYLLFYESTQP